ncbi:MAG: hypothetical protein ACYSWO_04760 [Planctomycetota bacterium]|jgi:hypothetical protein
MSKKKDNKAGTRRPRTTLLLLISAAIISIAAFIVGKFNAPEHSFATSSGEAALQSVSTETDSSRPADLRALAGRWVRMDTPYVLVITDAGKDGTLKAGYYNPRSINISRAEARKNEGELKVFVELRDVNYPGSTYNLTYDRARDLLVGVYFQAVTGQRYDVAFSRIRQKS